MIRILASLLLVMSGAAPASAQTAISQYPFCIQGEENPGWSGCSFNTLASCQAAASGTAAECLSNPWYQAGTNAATRSRWQPDRREFASSRWTSAELAAGPP